MVENGSFPSGSASGGPGIENHGSAGETSP